MIVQFAFTLATVNSGVTGSTRTHNQRYLKINVDALRKGSCHPVKGAMFIASDVYNISHSFRSAM
jgi:hypothetical protein